MQFKAKWGGQLELNPELLGYSYFLLDPRHPNTQNFLFNHPLLFVDGKGLSVLSCASNKHNLTEKKLFLPSIGGIKRRFLLIPDSYCQTQVNELSSNIIQLPINDDSDPEWLIGQIFND